MSGNEPKSEGIEEVIERKVKPLIDAAMHQYLGVTIEEVRADISDRLKKTPFFELSIYTELPYKKAKEKLRSEFLTRLLRRHLGNVSIAARAAGLDRRSMHRLVERHNIDVQRFRQDMTKRSYLKQTAITNIIEKTLDEYKPSLNKEKINEFYQGLPNLSKDIVEILPEKELTLDEAEREWERRYLKHHLEKNEWNVSATARSIGIRYETLHRKIKELGIEEPQDRQH